MKNSVAKWAYGRPGKSTFGPAVVDEAHRVHSCAGVAAEVEQYAPTRTRQFILSGAPWPYGKDIRCPSVHLLKVSLNQVVRSSRRIVAAASPFDKDATPMTLSQRGAVGPPLV